MNIITNLETLRREVRKGDKAYERGDFTAVDRDGLKQLFDGVKSRGRNTSNQQTQALEPLLESGPQQILDGESCNARGDLDETLSSPPSNTDKQ